MVARLFRLATIGAFIAVTAGMLVALPSTADAATARNAYHLYDGSSPVQGPCSRTVSTYVGVVKISNRKYKQVFVGRTGDGVVQTLHWRDLGFNSAYKFRVCKLGHPQKFSYYGAHKIAREFYRNYLCGDVGCQTQTFSRTGKWYSRTW